MQFDFSVTGLQGSGISVWDAAHLVHMPSVEFHKLRNVLEEFGQRSAKAQGLRAPITDIWRLRSSGQRLYLQTAAAGSNACVLLGGLKVGTKKLYIHRSNGAIAEVEPLCVLDFYVHEAYQRQGVGKAVFEHMLEAEQLTPEQLAYDRPSPKLLSFLRKHYGLCSYVPQSNNFVVFEQHFNDWSLTAAQRAGQTAGNISSGGGSSMQHSPVPSVGNGRQSVHVVGTAAAAGVQEALGQQWVPTSLRPPTPSLQHSVQLHTAQVDGGGSSWHSPPATAAALTASIGGPGCPPAGMPSHKPDRWDRPQLVFGSQQAPGASEVQYARGAGFKALAQGPGPALDDSQTFKGYEQALLTAAANPAPVLSPGVRDSLDQFTSSMVNGSSSGHNTTTAQKRLGAATASCRELPWAPSDLRCSSITSSATGGHVRACGSGGGAAYTANPQYSLIMPYGSLEPQPGSLLPPEAERVSLRRQEQQQQQQQQQQLQQRLQQQVARWEAVGAGPAGHLLASPTSSYAVPTAAMAEVIGRSHHQQDQGQGGADSTWQQQQGRWQQQPSSGLGTILSWDGLPTADMARGQRRQQQQQQLYRSGSNDSFKTGGSSRGQKVQQQQQQQQRGMQLAGELGYAYSSSSSRSGSGGGIGQGTLDTLGSAKAAARSHRAGSGAASCLRMV